MAMRLTLAFVILLGYSASAQELPDLQGEWNFTVNGLEAHPQCGAQTQTGVLDIDRKIAARAYRGKARTEQSYEKCPGNQAAESAATIRIKDGNLVTVEYDEEGWEMVRLRYVDGAMSGTAKGGVSFEWVRAEVPGADEGPTPEQLAELDAFLGEVEAELNVLLSEEYYERLRKSLYKSGLGEEDSVQVAEVTVGRMTSCMLEMMRESVLAQDIPVDQVLNEKNVTLIFNPQAVDMKTNTCVQDAAWNAGVRIR